MDEVQTLLCRQLPLQGFYLFLPGSLEFLDALGCTAGGFLLQTQHLHLGFLDGVVDERHACLSLGGKGIQDKGGTVGAVSDGNGTDGMQDGLEVLDNRGGHGYGITGYALHRLADVVAGYVPCVRQVGYLPGQRRTLPLHQVVELATLRRHGHDGGVELLARHLASRHQLAHLVCGDTELFCQFLGQWDAAPHELAQVLREHPTLCHGGAVEHHHVVERYAQPRGYVAQTHKCVVDILGCCAVGQQLLGTVGDTFEVERCLGGCLGQLGHEGVSLVRTAEHGLKGYL